MNEKQILNKIIEEEGDCSWSRQSICDNCPISKLRTKEDGTFYSCIEAVNIKDLSAEEADRKYKEIAERLLLDQEVHDLLNGDIFVNH